MPTYKKRTGISGTIQEHGVSVHSTTQTVATRKILTEARLTFSDISGYLVGELITEATSSVTGYIYWIDTTANTMGVVWASDAFTGGLTITGGTSTTAKTPTSVTNILNRTADTPVHTPLLHTHSLTSTGVGDDQTVYLDERTKWVLIWQHDTDILVCNFSSAYPMMPLPLGKPYVSFRVEHKLAKLVLQFATAGSCQLLELVEEVP